MPNIVANTADRHGLTPIHFAILNNHRKFVEQLLMSPKWTAPCDELASLACHGFIVPCGDSSSSLTAPSAKENAANITRAWSLFIAWAGAKLSEHVRNVYERQHLVQYVCAAWG